MRERAGEGRGVASAALRLRGRGRGRTQVSGQAAVEERRQEAVGKDAAGAGALRLQAIWVSAELDSRGRAHGPRHGTHPVWAPRAPN